MKKILIPIGLFSASTLIAYAVGFPNPIGYGKIEDVIGAIIDFILIISVPLLSGAVIYGGLLMITSGGDPKKFENGYKTILYGIVGFVIVLLAKGVSMIIKDVLSG